MKGSIMVAKTEKQKFAQGEITVNFEGIQDPGSYYNHTTGWLVRMPADSLAQGHSPIVNIVTKEQSLFTRISPDPFVPLGKARQICANLDFDVNF
jgi:hypothetical protein